MTTTTSTTNPGDRAWLRRLGYAGLILWATAFIQLGAMLGWG